MRNVGNENADLQTFLHLIYESIQPCSLTLDVFFEFFRIITRYPSMQHRAEIVWIAVAVVIDIEVESLVPVDDMSSSPHDRSRSGTNWTEAGGERWSLRYRKGRRPGTPL